MPDDNDKSLRELYERCQFGTPEREGDPAKFEAELGFFHSLSPLIIAYARRMGFSYEDAQDINQEVFIAIAKQGRRQKEITSSLLAYCLGIARHKAFRLLKKRKLRFEDICEYQQFTVDFPAQNEDEENLVMARSKLKYSFQEVLTLYYDYEMTAAEAAAVLNEPVKTVETRKKRALQALSRNLQFLREKN